MPCLFQPTLPARGATCCLMASCVPAFAISTHAPRTGSDVARTAGGGGNLFQPTLPARGATIAASLIFALSMISTHAPRTGSDPTSAERSSARRNFNPRSPHGERHGHVAVRLRLKRISTHAPRTGSDSRSSASPRPRRNFNPRSPHGERQRKVTILSIRIIGFAQKVYHKTVLLRISLAENAVILPEKP